MDVPVLGEDGEVKGWRSITNREDLHATVVERNRNHLHKDSATPIRHEEGYDLFHGLDQHNTTKEVLDRKLEWEHPVEEVNDFISNMKIAYDPDALQEEVDKINEDIAADNFRYYFAHKDDSTELSSSGRHIGYYKAILSSDKLVDIIVAMLKIMLKQGRHWNNGNGS